MKPIRNSLNLLLLSIAAIAFTGCISVHRDKPERVSTTTTTVSPTTPSTAVQRTTTVY